MNETTKSRPILFSAPMVKALLDGRKTQTRRAIKNLPECVELISHVDGHDAPDEWHVISSDMPRYTIKCPYGTVGDRLWVRETWAAGDSKEPPEFVWYRADNSLRNIDGETLDTYGMKEPKWKPSIFMPRWASRITLEITDIRVQRLQEISARDALAEGITPNAFDFPDPIDDFHTLWDSINGDKPENAWQSNCWVWALTFKVLKEAAS